MRFLRTGVAVIAALSAFVPVSRAQEAASDIPPAHLAFVDGTATLTRDGDRDPAETGMPIVPGDVIRTDNGRADLLFPDGSALDLDEYSIVELLSPTLVRLSEGRLILTIVGAGDPAAALRLVVDTPMASVETRGPGECRVSLLTSASGTQTELAVVRGAAALTNERGSMPLRSAQRSLASDGFAPSYPQSFNSARLDAFVQWAGGLRDQRVGSSTSSRYLPAELRTYSGSLDRNGAWQYENDYGYVWYPSVAVDWQPYDDGYWSSVPAYGWTWIGASVWSWPTHHYGRWGYAGARWFWIPERRWAPAWVSWGAAPGYVSWCPLGFDNRPVFSWSGSSSDRRGRSGWTILARDRFGERGRNIRHERVSPRALPSNVPFITQTSAPPAPSRATRRGNPGVSPGGRTNASSTSGFSPRAPATPAGVDNGRDRWRSAPPSTAPAGGAPDRGSPRAVPRDGRSTPPPSGSDRYARPVPLPPGQTRPQADRADDAGTGRAPSRSRNPMIYPAPRRPQAESEAPPPSGNSRRSTIESSPVPAEREGRTAAPQRRAGRAYETAPAPSPSPSAAEPQRSRRETSGRRADAPEPQPAPRARESSSGGQDRSSAPRAVPRGRDSGGSAPAGESRRSSGDDGPRAGRRPR